MKRFLVLFVLLLVLFSRDAYAERGIPLIARGFGRTLFSVMQIPKDMLTHSTKAFPLGVVGGAVSGSMKAVAGTMVGAWDMARGAAPYAKYAVFL